MKYGLKYYSKKLLEMLRAQPAIGGLEISDIAARFVSFDGKEWRTASVQFPPGLMRANAVANKEEFLSVMRPFRDQIAGDKKGAKVNVVVSLSSVNIYSQVFSLPLIQGENLEKAIQLNVQMVSPAAASETYSGWQMVGQDQSALRLEVLSAFVNRKVVDDLSSALEEAGFVIVAIESRALSLSRLIREQGAGVELQNPYVVLSLDSTGIDLLIIRGGHLYFEYFTSWADVAGEGKQISMPAFESAITRNLYQVMNFYNQHWSDPLREAIIVASGLEDEIQKIVEGNFSLKVRKLALKLPAQFSEEWFTALGSSLRGFVPRSEDRDISLLGVGAREMFHREQLISFLRLWRVAIPLTLGILLFVFASSEFFLASVRNSIESDSAFTSNAAEVKASRDLQSEASQFNRLISLISSARAASSPKSIVIGHLFDLASGQGAAASSSAAASAAPAGPITIDSVYYQGGPTPVSLTGEAQAENDILQFKNALSADPMFKNVDLPLTGIKSTAAGALSFSLSFNLAVPASGQK